MPGVTRLFVDVNGALFPCERVSEESSIMKIGTLEHGIDPDKVPALLNVGTLTAADCAQCWALRHCDQCAAAADVLTGLSADKKRAFCKASRAGAEERLKDIATLATARNEERRKGHGDARRGVSL